MKQVLRKGLKHIVVDEVPDPPLASHHVLVSPAFSLISSGTETADIHREGILKEVADNPSHVRKVLDESDLLYYREGRGSVVTVIETGGVRSLVVMGKTVASDSQTDMQHELLLGHLPALLHPDPKSAVVIGLGAAGTLVWNEWTLARQLAAFSIARASLAEGAAGPAYVVGEARASAPARDPAFGPRSTT